MSDEASRLSAPTASNFAGEDAQSLRPGPQKFRVGNAVAPLCDSDSGATQRHRERQQRAGAASHVSELTGA